jgi:hypothetical protein
MTAQVVFLNSWLNCPDDVLRYHYILQQKISEGKAKLWYDITQLNIDPYQASLCHDRWIHSNRDRLKLVGRGENEDGLN